MSRIGTPNPEGVVFCGQISIEGPRLENQIGTRRSLGVPGNNNFIEFNSGVYLRRGHSVWSELRPGVVAKVSNEANPMNCRPRGSEGRSAA